MGENKQTNNNKNHQKQKHNKMISNDILLYSYIQSSSEKFPLAELRESRVRGYGKKEIARGDGGHQKNKML